MPILRALLLLALLALPQAALAHAQFLGASPAQDAVVPRAPQAVTLDFSEPVSPAALRWVAPDGSTSEAAPLAEAEPGRVSVAPPPAAGGEGTWLLSWRVVSLDGHPVTGTLQFSIGAPSPVAPLPALVLPPAQALWAVAARYLLSVLLVAGAGGAVFAGFVAPLEGRVRRLVRVSLWLVAPAAALALGTLGLDLAGRGPGALLTAEPWRLGAGTALGRTAALALAAAAAGLLALRPGRGAVLAAAAAWALAALSFTVSGHSAVAEPALLALSMIAVHAAALVFWLGALLPLAAQARAPGGAAVLARFSAIGVPMVVLLLGSGVLLTFVHGAPGGFEALASSGYGMLLLAKLGAVAGLLTLALHNRLSLTPALRAGRPGAAAALRGSIRAEVILALAILLFASAFRLSPPPAPEGAPQVLTVELAAQDLAGQLHLSPGRAGQNELRLDLGQAAPLEVTVQLRMPEEGIDTGQLTAEQGEDGSWRAGPVSLPLAGDWTAVVTVLVSDFEAVRLTEGFALR
jgi:copper transport protein